MYLSYAYATHYSYIHSPQLSRASGTYGSQTGQNRCANDAVKIPVSSNNGQHFSGVAACNTQDLADLNTIDR